MLRRARSKTSTTTLRVRVTKRALSRLERLADKHNASPEQLVERFVGDMVAMAMRSSRSEPHRKHHDHEGEDSFPGYA